ncbi:hypothetical protein SCOR_20675 [Sulfidibacter corallicola]|uniref:6-bladed beta-propeller n=1 Tax=Sulfidibacter corallicola TaxID=2818388 RepID=A0A8A4TT58_SULCO|nr:hypothetical protein [Sulfidibacter corallicola]QTD53146.1 hypothetical protein J3U87_11855 [Sulfidibacter corallicola]
MSLLLVLILFTTPQHHSFELERSENFRLGDAYNVQVAADGSILMAEGPKLFHWDLEGNLIRVIEPVPNKADIRGIITFAYAANEEMYWVVDFYENQVFFFDRSGNLLGSDWSVPPDAEDPESVLYRRLIPCGSRIFAMDVASLTRRYPGLPKVFQLLEVKIPKEGARIERVGPLSYPIRQQLKNYNYKFKQHWIVQREFSKHFFVVDELSTTMQEYGPEKGKNVEDGLIRLVREIPLMMEDRVPPKPPNFEEIFSSREQHLKWISSFSRVKGLYPLGKDLLIGYSLPDETVFGRLVLQRIDMKGNRKGHKVLTDGILLGSHDGSAFVLEKPPEGSSGRYIVHAYKL